jgi:sorting and assembly machinery component 37
MCMQSIDTSRHYRPTSLDALLAAHVLLLAEPPFPDELLRSLVRESYPSLVQHARRVRSHAFPSGTDVTYAPPLKASLSQLIPWPRSEKSDAPPVNKEKQELDRSFALQRWLWIGTAVAASAIYLAMTVKIVIVRPGQENDDGGEDDADGDDGDEGEGTPADI